VLWLTYAIGDQLMDGSVHLAAAYIFRVDRLTEEEAANGVILSCCSANKSRFKVRAPPATPPSMRTG